MSQKEQKESADVQVLKEAAKQEQARREQAIEARRVDPASLRDPMTL